MMHHHTTHLPSYPHMYKNLLYRQQSKMEWNVVKRRVVHSIYLWAPGMDVVNNGSSCMLKTLSQPVRNQCVWWCNLLQVSLLLRCKNAKEMAIFSLLREEAQPSEIREMATFFGKRWLLSSQEKSKWVFIEAAAEYICRRTSVCVCEDAAE